MTTLAQTIEEIKETQITSTKLLRSIKRIVKALHEYSSDSQKIPPDTLIPCCLFVLPSKISEKLLGLAPEQALSEAPEKLSINLLVQLYLKSLLKMLQDSSDEINHVLVEGMSRCVNLLHGYPVIAKKWLKAIVEMWSQSQKNLNLSLRCHLLLQRYLSNAGVDSYSWVLRRMYVSYFDNCRQVSWRNYEHINFMINSMCEILKINESRGYYVLFGYLRSIALQLDKYNKLKGKEKIEMLNKLYSNQLLNCFKLFAAIVSRDISEQFSSLLYPLIQIVTFYSKLTQSPEFLPLKLKLIDFLLQISESTNIFIPFAFELIESFLQNKIFMKKIHKKGQNVSDDVEIIYRLSKADLSNANLVNFMHTSVMTKMYKFVFISLKNVYGIEVVQKLQKGLKNLKNEYKYSGFKAEVTRAAKMIESDVQRLFQARKKAGMSIRDIKQISIFENKRVKFNFKLGVIQEQRPK